MTLELRGLIPVLATPFTANARVDEASLRAIVASQLACRVDGLATLGFASEASALTARERELVVRVVAAECAGSVPVVAGLGGTGALPVAEEARALEQAGADALMVLPPYLVKPDHQRLVEFFDTVAAAVSIPLMVQDTPETGVAMPIAALRDLAKIDGVRYTKVEARPPIPKIAGVCNALGDGLPVFGGRNAQACLDEFAVGAVGTMPGAAMTPLLRAAIDHWMAGDETEARRVHNRLVPLMALCANSGCGVAIAKEILRRRRIIATSAVRNPTRPLDAVTLASLAAVLADLPELVAQSQTRRGVTSASGRY